MRYELKHLIDKLNQTCREGLQAAAERCVNQTNYDVEIEHLLLGLFERADTDIHAILMYYEAPIEPILAHLTHEIEKLKRGNTRTPALSPKLTGLISEAWLQASLALKTDSVRSGALLLALLENAGYRECIAGTPLAGLSLEKLHQDIGELIAHSNESGTKPPVAKQASAGSTEPVEARTGDLGGSPKKSDTPTLDQYTIDLTGEARAGRLDPIVGRDMEIRQMTDILTRRRQNNPILIGQAGVGKTAVVEGFALKVAAGEVPKVLADVTVRSLDLGLLQAGAGIRGEFEQRLKTLMTEIKGSLKPVILFIDEAHTLIGAGGAEGLSDAANLIKPALARGELRTIAATTWSEYKKYFEKDAALSRRFQDVKIDEPDEAGAIAMVRAGVTVFERHHQVRILDEAVRDAVKLSNRYITGRQLPDKAVSVLDTACARVALHWNAMPVPLEAAVREIEGLSRELAILERETEEGTDHTARQAELKAQKERTEAKRAELETRRQKEREIAGEYNRLLDEKATPSVLAEVRNRLSAMQGEDPMYPLCVDSNIVASVISDWTGIPVGRMLTDDIEKALQLKAELAKRVIGQDHALDVIARRIASAKADLSDPGKPLGVFMLVGPSGIGKTETAHSLAELMYGGDRNLITVNMSEFQEPHSVSVLKGAPPGYVGYGKGGVLTEAVRRAPYSVVLLDEVEKAHPDVLEVFYQVFDKGYMEDGEGQKVDFKNTIILLTGNVGGGQIMEEATAGEIDPEAVLQRIRPILGKTFHDAFLGRLIVVPYLPLPGDVLNRIIRLKLDRVAARFKDRHHAALSYDDGLVEHISARCNEVASGARNVDHIITQSLLPELSMAVLARMAKGESFESAKVGVGEDGDLVCELL